MNILGSFPLSNDEIQRLYQKIRNVDVADLDNAKNVDATCLLLTGSWDAFKSRDIFGWFRELDQPGKHIFGINNGILGTGDIWISPHLSAAKFTEVFAHEMSHLITNSLVKYDEYGLPAEPLQESSHNQKFQTVNNRVCKTIHIPKATKQDYEDWHLAEGFSITTLPFYPQPSRRPLPRPVKRERSDYLINRITDARKAQTPPKPIARILRRYYVKVMWPISHVWYSCTSYLHAQVIRARG